MIRSSLTGRLALLMFLLVVSIVPTRAATIAWTNTAGGNWSDASSWNPNQVPSTTDDAQITAAGTYVVTLDTSPMINSLTLGGVSGRQRLTNAANNLTLANASTIAANGVLDISGGSMTSTNLLTVSGTINWQNASWTPTGGVSLTSSATLNIQNNLDLYGALTNQGAVNWQGGYVRLWNDGAAETGAIWNQAGGSWTIQCDQPLYAGNGPEQFHNAGSVRKIGGLGFTTLYPYFDNSGTLEARFGTVIINGNSNLRGGFVADVNAAVDFAGSYTNGPAVSLSGAGTFALVGGTATLTLQANIIPNLSLNGGTVFLDPTFQNGTITNLNLYGATLGGTNLVTGVLNVNNGGLAGSLTVQSGGVFNANTPTLSGPVTIGANAVFNFSGGTLNTNSSILVAAGATMNILNTLYLYSAVTNQGIVNWEIGHIYVYNDGLTQTGAIWNQVPGVWNISVLGGYYIVAQPVGAVFHNASLLRQTTAVATSFLQIYLDNTGLVEAQNGTLQLTGGSSLGGVFQADTNAAIDFSGVNYTNSTAVNLTGQGTFQLTGGALVLVTNPIPNLQLNGGTVLLAPTFQGGTITNLALTGATLGGTNTVTGVLTLNASVTTGALTIASGGLLNIQGGTVSFEGLLTNFGTVDWLSGYINVINNAGAPYDGEIWNQPGAVWNLQCDQTMAVNYGGEQFHNRGTLRKNNSTGTTSIGVYLDNSGTVEAQSGTIQFNGLSNLGGNFLSDSGAVIAFSFANYTNSAPPSFAGAGSFQFVGGNLTLLSNVIPNLQLTGGTVYLGPNFQGGTITNMTLNGAYLGGTNAISGLLILNDSWINGSLTVLSGGTLDWGNGPAAALNGGSTLNIQSNAVLNITGPVSFAGPATNQGTVNWTAGIIYVVNNSGAPYNGVVKNLPGAVWNIECDQSFNDYFGGEQLFNAGTFRKTQSYGTTAFTIGLLNSGTIEAQTGTIQLLGGSDLGGSFIADAAGDISIGGNNITNFASPAQNFIGAGTFQSISGTLVLLTNTIPNMQLTGGSVLLDPSFQGGTITNLALNGAQLGGTNLTVTGLLSLTSSTLTGMVTVLSGGTFSATNATLLATTTVNGNGVLNWSVGTLAPASSLTIAPGGTFNIVGGGGLLDLQSTVTNEGTVNWESGTIRQYNYAGTTMGADIWNQAGAVWNDLCDANFYNAAGTEIFHNAGTFRKSASVGSSSIGLIFDNAGLLDAQSGTMSFGTETVTLESAGTMNFGINGLLNYGGIYLAGPVALNGTLGANFNNGYTPEIGDTFTPLAFTATVSGTFTGLNLPANDSWQTTYSAAALSLTVQQGLELAPIPPQVIRGATPFTVTAAVADSEVPPDSLTYSLGSHPGSMTIDPNTGVINWTPSNAASTNTVVVNVTDNGVPALHSSTSFTLLVVPSHVNAAPVLPVLTTQNVNELTPISVVDTAMESDIYATVAYSLISAPAGATIDTNGVVTWTPSQSQSHSTNLFIVAATNTDAYVGVNTHLGATNTFNVIVHEVNVAPYLPVILSQTVNELTPLSVTNTATEANIHATSSYGLVNPPLGVTISGSGVISWTPSQLQSPSTNLIVTVVTNTDLFDTTNPHLYATNSFAVVVNEVNVAPTPPVIATRNVNELTLLTVTNSASESNIHATITGYSLVNPPAGATISPAGVITWTPTQTQSPGNYTIQTIVTNSDAYDRVNPILTATNSFTVNVIEVNVAPALPVIAATNVNELTLLTVNDTATESNIHSTITGYGLLSPPTGAAINSSGIFTWTPSQNESPGAYVITVVATNSDPQDLVNPHLTSTNQFTVNVIEVNVAPILPVLPSTNIAELTPLSVPNTAFETNIHATLTYGLVNAPSGMTISASGVINWTPSQQQSPGTNVITTIVTNTDSLDTVNSHLYATNSFTVVVREVNVAPALPVIATTNIDELTLLNVTNAATESNQHSAITGYTLVNPPSGISISPAGVISWTPSQAQSPGAYVVKTIVSNTNAYDSINPILTATNSFTVNVIEINVAPVLAAIPNQTIAELTTLTVTNTAAESNIHATLAYGLVNPPQGMTINASGVISWMPTQQQSPSTNLITTVVTNTDSLDTVNPHLLATNTFTVFVREANVPPTLPVIPATNIAELTLLTVTNTATDSNVHSALSYALIAPPAGMSIDTNGVITWTPAQTQSPSTNTITVVAISTDPSDTADTYLASIGSFTVVVHEVNVAPVLPAIPTQTVNAQTALNVTNTAAETNIHATLTYGLVNPPLGMTINSSGVISWTPSLAQGHATNVITTVVTNTDAFDTVNPHYYATNSFTVIVYAPVLAPIGNFTVNPGQTVTFTASGTENDASRTLTYSLNSGPAGASINANTGSFQWRPSVTNGNTTNTIVVKLSDNSVPQLAVTQSFTVTVSALFGVTLTSISYTPAQAQIHVTGPIGPDYYLQASVGLTNGGWTSILTNTPSASPFTVADTNASNFTRRFYRIQLGP